jgi:DNA-binding response OmpR family regulator
MRPEQRALDLIVLALEDGDVLAQVRQLRAQFEVPLIVIADRIEERLHVALLDVGADLVVLRPFSGRLLVAQVRALLRRALGQPLLTLPTLSIGALSLDPAVRTVQVEGRSPKRLTQLEFRLLYTLMTHRGQILSADALVEHVWGYAGEGDRDLVRGLVSRLRAKVEPEPRSPRYIVTVPGAGYSLNTDDKDAA